MKIKTQLPSLRTSLAVTLMASALNVAWADSLAIHDQETEPFTQQQHILKQNAQSSLLSIQHQWAQAQYRSKGDEQEKSFESLIKEIDALAVANPDKAEPKIWQGIIRSTYAGAKGGLSALSLVKSAKEYLEAALKLNDQALNGSAYTSLASLYFKVPGWPIGFGDDDKAEELFEQALNINPTGIDPNYFYAEYLVDEGDYEKAYVVLDKAQNAPVRKDRPLADEARREEVRLLLEQVEAEVTPVRQAPQSGNIVAL